MASETKVGLLAGLAFIVCFAVILANRGQTQRHVANTVATPGLAPADYNLPSRDRGLPRTGVIGSRTSAGMNPDRAVSQQDMPVRELERAASRDDFQGPTASGTEVDWTTAADEPSVRRPGTRQESIPKNEAREATPSVAGRNGTALAATNDQSRSATALERLLNQKSQVVDPQSDVRSKASKRNDSPRRALPSDATHVVPGSSGTNAPPAAAAGFRTYAVQPGDTLSAIARRMMGSAVNLNIRAIVDANRAVLSDPDLLKVGMTLAIPPQREANVRSDVVREQANPQARLVVDRRATTNETRWYQVRSNDRYARIAREQLGDESRWHELYELNKEKFPDPDRIREGVRIKIPAR